MPGTNRFAYVFQEFGGLRLHHRALLVETSEEVAFYAVHMCSIAETKAPGQGADGSVGLKPNIPVSIVGPITSKCTAHSFCLLQPQAGLLCDCYNSTMQIVLRNVPCSLRLGY